ncbi:MAG: B12-binding domain-containing radical SAM protein, partial [Bacteroidetes bacterium]|nr:B12-binding domain-containing radical SAM protein [Bacteroidota bacterium]
MNDLLLITPPFTQLNTPYPATAYLKGFLNTKGISSYQMDLGIEVILDVFSKEGLERLFDMAEEHIQSENAERIFALHDSYIQHIDQVIRFLQGSNSSFARQICIPDVLPQAARFDQAEELDYAFGTMGLQDKAKHLATLFIEDLSDFIVECVDPHFGFSRYAERLGMSANSFDELHEELQASPTHIDNISLSILRAHLERQQPKLVCFSVPFPGNLYSAFRAAKCIKDEFPGIKLAMGGGFPNTELRSLTDVRVFDYFDFISLDDGELPIELIADHVLGGKEAMPELKRTYWLKEGQVYYDNRSSRPDYKQSQVGTPDYSDLHLEHYLSVIEVTNPMHSLWTDGRWLKLTMAHGCYWGKCTFCDISLDYIKLYEPLAANLLVDRMQEMIAQTGERGFHFVDEAAPPALMRALALEILRRGLSVTWWTNIRFEKAFTRDLCRLLKASGCVAVSGGLEVASDRLLALIDKGVTVEQVARVCAHFTEAGIMTHAYLMYGYPTQTVQETVDSLEMVRQLFELGIIQSGFWHQFALTAHSPVGMDPEAYGVLPERKEVSFAENDLAFTDRTGIDHEQFSFGLKKSLLNYMNGIGLDYPLQYWFEQDIPESTVRKRHLKKCLEAPSEEPHEGHSKLLWLGTLATVEP